ncbi:P1 family peptidase [Pseudomonas chlororaphis]|uniref:DmpA family aminopeptidase n=1 Tax=Pseudomonas chlororaphis TaxID=587753 RepID=UPI0023658184|nr:P1 family peptidase [Pseudomonas chlororaphis]WDH22092.1 P1 family peptidase [Pseudomonas chlororaphis]
MTKPRARELGLAFQGQAGPYSAITDVPGVRVGYKTINRTTGNGRHVQTGVTAILPRGYVNESQPVWAGFHALNGNGEMTGTQWIEDGGYFVGPVCLTNTHSVGIVHQAATRWTIDHYADAWESNHLWAMPVVAETYDGVINDINGLHISEEDALCALGNAVDGAIAEGNVGGGNGMICYGFKGGTGTSSRKIKVDGEAFTLGVLVQANHGIRDWLQVLAVPVGRHFQDELPDVLRRERGSIIVVIATDTPMLPHQLRRLARLASLGIGRAGTPGGNNSGDIFLAFSVANPNPNPMPQLSGMRQCIDYLNDDFFEL